MEGVGRSQSWVEEFLATVGERYSSFAVNQSTVTVSRDRYERAREDRRAGRVDAYLAVHNDRGEILHVEDGDGPSLPHRSARRNGPLAERLRETVREATGIRCRVEDLETVTIVGVRNGDDPDAETVYHLLLVFRGTYVSGEAGPDATWRESRSSIEPSYV